MQPHSEAAFDKSSRIKQRTLHTNREPAVNELEPELVYVIPISENDCPVLDNVAAMPPWTGWAEDLAGAAGPTADDAWPNRTIEQWNKHSKTKQIQLGIHENIQKVSDYVQYHLHTFLQVQYSFLFIAHTLLFIFISSTWACWRSQKLGLRHETKPYANNLWWVLESVSRLKPAIIRLDSLRGSF